MAGRIRTIKPELLEDEKTAGLTSDQFRVFVGSILLADDHGNLRGRPEYIESSIFWLRKRPVDDVAKDIDELIRVGLLTEYHVSGQRYLSITNWEKHQKISHVGAPRVPRNVTPCATDSGGLPENLRPDLRSPISDHDLCMSPAAPTPKPRSKGTKTPCPESTDLSAKDWCSLHAVDWSNQESRRFLDHHHAKGNKFVSWAAAWRNWVSGRFVPSGGNANSWHEKGSRTDVQPYHREWRPREPKARQEASVGPAIVGDFLKGLNEVKPPDLLSEGNAHVAEPDSRH